MQSYYFLAPIFIFYISWTSTCLLIEVELQTSGWRHHATGEDDAQELESGLARIGVQAAWRGAKFLA